MTSIWLIDIQLLKSIFHCYKTPNSPELGHFLDGIPSVLTDPATPAAVVGVYNHISCPNDKQQQCENVHYCNYSRVE